MRIAQFKDKVEKIVTRKAATSSNPVHDDNETETKRRYNLRKRKLQDEKDHCPSNTNKNRRIIWLHNDGPTKVSKLKTNTLRRSKRGATKRTFSTEQADEKKSSHKKQKWNPGKRIPTKSLKRKIQSSMNTISNSRKKAKTLPTFNKKSGISTSVNMKKAPSLAMKETKSSSTLAPAVKGRVRASPNIKGNQEGSRKTNPSPQKKRKAARVKRSTPEKKLQIRTQRSKKERCCKELPGMFAKMFLKKLDLVSCIKGMDENNYSQIPGISVTHDNLVWVNHLQNKKEVKLYNSAGELLRSFDLDYYPVFNSCMPNGDLLVTRIHTVGAKPIVELFSREGKTRMLADLSTHTEKLSGIIYQDERIYVIGHSCYKSSILKLDMNGEVEEVFEPKPECITIEHIISQNGQIFALKNDIFSMHLLGSDKISSEAINKVVVDKSYSASASVDNFGNIIIGVHSPGPKIVIIDPRLERKHEIRCDFSERIRSTAVDKQNHLWIGTDDGHLYIAKYLK
ncbi:uncharacterized protein LOC128176662 [Crassostrea angulata]|uniref:uncharacterized protein LOC128176662 n=1 Tax=Magallana angulata TaxID=2784310 RepID=UPI0022B08EC6|nr:uncharacterized protein LOC128176662 [Crassostrea angulata]XP_052699113.1 uncharacterized protein LOC128176662 [Crassostrea angulata]